MADELRIQDLSIEQYRYLVRGAFDDVMRDYIKRGTTMYADEPPAIRGKVKMGEFLGIGRKAMEELIEKGVFEGVVLNCPEAPNTYTAFPNQLRERYTAYINKEYEPTKKRYYKPKA